MLVHPPLNRSQRHDDHALDQNHHRRRNRRVLLVVPHQHTHKHRPRRRVEEPRQLEQVDAAATHQEPHTQQRETGAQTDVDVAVVSGSVDQRTRYQTRRREHSVHNRLIVRNVHIHAVPQHVHDVQRRPVRTAVLHCLNHRHRHSTQPHRWHLQRLPHRHRGLRGNCRSRRLN